MEREAELEQLEELRALIEETCRILWEIELEGPFLRLPDWTALQREVFALPLLLIAVEEAKEDLDGRPFFAGNARWWWCAEQAIRIGEALTAWALRGSRAAA